MSTARPATPRAPMGAMLARLMAPTVDRAGNPFQRVSSNHMCPSASQWVPNCR